MTAISGPPPPRDLGAVLWQLLPQVYRTRDNGDLERFLDACGDLLDAIHATLEQRLADCFPDAPPEGRASQAWLLPYFGRLVDARPRSPHVEGRRREVAEAIAWRQRKGTLGGVEAIAEATIGRSASGLGGREVELREGFRGVATTLHVDRLRLAERPDPSSGMPVVGPLAGALLAGTTAAVDLPSRAVRVSPDTPGARASSFGRQALASWAVLNAGGVPCFPGAYDDLTRRTVDVRESSHAHPRTVLLHVAPPLGFFAPGHDARRGAPAGAPDEAEVEAGTATGELRDRRIGTLTVTSGPLRLVGCTVGRVVVDAPALAGDAAVLLADGCRIGAIAANRRVRLRSCHVTGEVRAPAVSARDTLAFGSATPLLEAGRIRLQRCAVESLRATDANAAPRSLTAARSLLGTVTAAGAAQLEYCTVLGSFESATLAASDSLVAGAVALTGPGDALGCVRYSRLPAATARQAALRTYRVTTAEPVFARVAVCGAPAGAGFSAPGSGVLDALATPAAIRFGADDGGELGAYHDDAHSLEELAMADQVADHLPHGIDPVLVPDARLHALPPKLREVRA